MHVFGQYRFDDGGQRHHRAHRQIDPTGHDHECHADCDNQQEGVIDQQVEQHLPREKAGVHHGAETEQRAEQQDGHGDGQQRHGKRARRGRLDHAHREHHGRLDDERRLRRHADRVGRISERLDNQCAQHRARQTEAAPEQRGAAERHRQNRVEFEQQARVIAIGAAHVRTDEDARHRGGQARETVHREHQRFRAQADEACRHRIDADRANEKPERRAFNERRGGKHGRACDPHRARHAKPVPAADQQIAGCANRYDLPRRQQLCDAAPGHHQDQRGDDRLHADERHQQSVPHAAQYADDQRRD
ncbi:hypothetical protein KCU90_g3008, partial [Aureobasidium melanogenum]